MHSHFNVFSPGLPQQWSDYMLDFFLTYLSRNDMSHLSNAVERLSKACFQKSSLLHLLMVTLQWKLGNFDFEKQLKALRSELKALVLNSVCESRSAMKSARKSLSATRVLETDFSSRFGSWNSVAGAFACSGFLALESSCSAGALFNFAWSSLGVSWVFFWTGFASPSPLQGWGSCGAETSAWAAVSFSFVSSPDTFGTPVGTPTTTSTSGSSPSLLASSSSSSSHSSSSSSPWDSWIDQVVH